MSETELAENYHTPGSGTVASGVECWTGLRRGLPSAEAIGRHSASLLAAKTAMLAPSMAMIASAILEQFELEQRCSGEVRARRILSRMA